MKKLTIIIFILLLPNGALATAQFADEIIYEGQNMPLFANPLESYFNKDHPRPDKLLYSTCTANWRGYVATWKIEGNDLYLIRLDRSSCVGKENEIKLSRIFPGQKGPIKAIWFSGLLRIPKGKELEYVHMGYGSVYEQDLLLEIEKGHVIKVTVKDNSKAVK